MNDSVIKSNGTTTTKGINEEGLRNLIVKVGEEIETIKAAFLQMENLVDDSHEFFIGEVGNAFREKFSDIDVYYPNLEASLLSYKTDLENFLNSYINFEGNFKLTEEIDTVTASTAAGVSGFVGGVASTVSEEKK